MSEMSEVCRCPNGATLYRKPNGVGGYTYFSDEVGGGAVVWDTCIIDSATLLCAIVEEARRHHAKRVSPKPGGRCAR